MPQIINKQIILKFDITCTVMQNSFVSEDKIKY